MKDNNKDVQKQQIDNIKRDMNVRGQEYKKLMQIEQKDKEDKDRLIKITEEIFFKKAKIQQELKIVQQENANLKEKNQSYEKQLQNLRINNQKNHEFTLSLQEKIQLLETSIQEKDLLLKQISRKDTIEHQQKIQQKDNKSHLIDDLTQKLFSKVNEINHLKSNIQAKSFELNSERQRSTSKTQEILVLTKQLSINEAQYNKIQAKLKSEHAQKTKIYEQQFKQMEKELKQKSQKNRDLITDNINLRKYFQIMKKQYISILTNKNQQLKLIKTEFEQFIEQKKIKKTQINQNLRNSLQKQTKEVQFSHILTQKSNNMSNSEIKQEEKQLVKQYIEEIQKLTLILNEKQKISKGLQSKINLNKLENMISNSNLQNALASVKEFEQILQEKEKEIYELKSKNGLLMEKINKMDQLTERCKECPEQTSRQESSIVGL